MMGRRHAIGLLSTVFHASRLHWTRGMASRKVAVLGAAGGIGQPLGLLMKLSPLVSDLALFDIAGTPGVAADISHVNTQAKVS